MLEKDAAVDIGTRIQLYRGLKQWNTCYDLIQKYKSLNPEDKRTELDALGMYYTERREFEKALDSFQEAEKERPSTQEDWSEMYLKVKLYYGIALFLSGAEAEGVRMLNDCLVGYAELSPLNAVFDKEVQIAAIHTFLGNKEEAYKWLRKSNWTGWSLIVQEQGVLFSKISGEKEFQDIISSVKAERKEVREEIARLKAAGEWEI